MRAAADNTDAMSALIAWLPSGLRYGWILGVPSSTLENAARNSYYVVDDAFDEYQNSSRYRVTYKEYRSEVPGTGYLEVTQVRGL